MKNRKEKVYPYGFNQEKELLSYKKIGVKSKKNNRYDYFNDYSEWKKHIEQIAPLDEMENFEHYILKNIRDYNYFLQNIISLVIPLEAVAFSIIYGVPNDKNNFLPLIISLIAVAGVFSVFYYKIKSVICFYEDCYSILFNKK